MTLRPLAIAALMLAATACVSPGASSALQDAVNLSVSLTQHEDGVDIAEAATQLDERIAAAPENPYVLKVAATARAALASHAQDRALRVKLRHEALAEYDLAISKGDPDAPPRLVMRNGQQTEIDLSDLAELRGKLFTTIQTDR